MLHLRHSVHTMVNLGEKQIASQSLIRVYSELMVAGEICGIPESEDWEELDRRMSAPDRINEILPGVYRYFLGAFRPLLFGGSRFCIAHGPDELCLFWIANGRYFCRHLDREETAHLCDASGLSRDDGL